MRARYYLCFCGSPLCDHMGSQAGRALCEEAKVVRCSYSRLQDARAAKARLDICALLTAAGFVQTEPGTKREETIDMWLEMLRAQIERLQAAKDQKQKETRPCRE